MSELVRQPYFTSKLIRTCTGVPFDQGAGVLTLGIYKMPNFDSQNLSLRVNFSLNNGYFDMKTVKSGHI